MPVNELLSVEGVSFAYDKHQVLRDISFSIKQKDFVALIGPNGSGKTTLAKILLGILKPTKGRVTYASQNTTIGYTPQRYAIDKHFPGTVEEILSTRDEQILKQVGIQELMKKKFIHLSGGQQQRVLIALALEKEPELLILDEPTAGVDVKAQKSFYTLLQQLNKKGIAIILVTHEVGVISSLVKKVLCINHSICCMDHPKKMPSLLKKMYGNDFVQHHHHRGHHHD